MFSVWFGAAIHPSNPCICNSLPSDRPLSLLFPASSRACHSSAGTLVFLPATTVRPCMISKEIAWFLSPKITNISSYGKIYKDAIRVTKPHRALSIDWRPFSRFMPSFTILGPTLSLIETLTKLLQQLQDERFCSDGLSHHQAPSQATRNYAESRGSQPWLGLIKPERGSGDS